MGGDGGEAVGIAWLETFSFFFHSVKLLMPASDMQLNQSHHYKVSFFFLVGGVHGEVEIMMY